MSTAPSIAPPAPPPAPAGPTQKGTVMDPLNRPKPGSVAEIIIAPERAAAVALTFPDVRPAGDRQWFVASGRYCPGAWWLVTFPVGKLMDCPCPAGVKATAADPADAIGCRHARRAAAYCSALYRRPAMPCDAGAFVD